jgi:hypothetical protein
MRFEVSSYFGFGIFALRQGQNLFCVLGIKARQT